MRNNPISISDDVRVVTRRVSHLEQELLTIPEHRGSCCSIFSFLCNVLCIIFFGPFSFGHCLVCPLIYSYWLPLGIFKLFLFVVMVCVPMEDLVYFMVFIATFNNISAISWRSVLLVEETGLRGEKHLAVGSHWQTLSHNIVSI